MKKEEIEQELVETKKEVKSLKREINKLRNNWKIIDKIAKVALCVTWVYVAWRLSQYIVANIAILILGRAKCMETIWLGIITLLIYSLAIFLIIFIPKLVKKTWKSTRKSLGLNELPTFTDIGISIIGYIATIAIALVVISVLDKLNLVNSTDLQSTDFKNLATGFDRAIAYISIAIIPPIAEEIVFRGWLYGKLRQNLSKIPAIIIVSVFFALLHASSSPLNAVVEVGILSVMLCLEREITGTIHAGILTHIIQNSIAFALRIAKGLL